MNNTTTIVSSDPPPVAPASRPRTIGDLPGRLLELPGRSIHYFDQGRRVRKEYAEMHADVEQVARRYQQAGMTPRMRVGVLAENSYDWIVCELALLQLDCISVCFPPDEFRQATAEQLATSYGLHFLLLSQAEHQARGEAHTWVAALDGRGRHAADPAPRQSIRNEAIELEADVFTLVFSSGTSGKLKCLKISKHGTRELVAGFGRVYSFREDDALLAFLPLSIFQQRWMLYTALWYGFDLQVSGPADMFRAMKEMGPTILAAPPAFYELIESRLRAVSRPKRILSGVLNSCISALPTVAWRASARRRLFRPLHDMLGGRIRLLLTGGAPSRLRTLRLCRRVGLPLYEGFGLTETGYVSINLPGRDRLGSVGQPLRHQRVELADDGEVLVNTRHPLCIGYYGIDADEAASTFRPDNRIGTGDIGRLDEDGFLYLIGRKKQILITASGYKVHPESLERALETCTEVDRAVVFGGGDLRHLVAVVSPGGCGRPDARCAVERHVERVNARLPSATRIARVVFSPTSFTVENGLLNRNLKVDRHAVFDQFREQLLR